jgi:hypothetical protein
MFINSLLTLLCSYGALNESHCRSSTNVAKDQSKTVTMFGIPWISSNSNLDQPQSVRGMPGFKPGFLTPVPEKVTGETDVNAEEDGKMGSVGISALEASLRGGADNTIFTISPACDGCQNLCLDWAQSGGENYLQLWQCNGQEQQLWYWDAGSYQIQPGSDRTKCVDAGEALQIGTKLYPSNCDKSPQQTWSWDENTQTVSVFSNGKKYCMDLAGAKTSLGTAVQLWDCNGLWEQQWNVQAGITVRLTADWTYCMDLEGGKTENGTPIQLWKCNGHGNQKWFFDNWKIKYAGDPSKCIDAGSQMNSGNGLMLWDCNGLSQQNFGYDGYAVYLSQSFAGVEDGTELGAPFASLCMDLGGGEMKDGAVMQAWSCNRCWNQQFSIVGPTATSLLSSQAEGSLLGTVDSPTSITARRALQSAKGTREELNASSPLNSCPSRPFPPSPPAPPAPSKYLLPHCSDTDQYSWPVFKSQADLQASPWGQYFQTVYGEIPSEGYPICIYGFSMLYKPVVASTQVQVPDLQTDCPTTAGQYYMRMSGFPITMQAWIYNPQLAHPEQESLPGNHWVEVLHTRYKMDGTATWFYYAPGSAIYMWTGNTKAYNDHQDAVSDLLKETCVSKLNECGSYFEAMYKAALGAGLDSIQFMHHKDMQCNKADTIMKGLAVEIVDLKGPGMDTCSQSNSGKTRFRTGWQAKHICYCDNSEEVINCNGFGVKR